MRMRKTIFEYLRLTKPNIMLLVLVTGATSLVMEGSLIHSPLLFGLVLLGLLLSGGSANALNMYFERDIDSIMTRTKYKRPLSSGAIRPANALIFAITIGTAGVMIFAVFFNVISAVLALATIIFYAFFYTLFLKPRTRYNIVIGGAAGSMAPVIAWIAAGGSIAITPLMLFMIVFLWTPPHFWALALHIKKDYELVNFPMMPVVVGDQQTRRLILLYTLVLVGFSLLLYFAGAGLIYAIVAIVSGAVFIYRAVSLYRLKSNHPAPGLFRYSIIYLFTIFVGLMVDSAFGRLI